MGPFSGPFFFAKEQLMFVYSEAIRKFHSHLRYLIKDILTNEMQIQVLKTRFKFNQYTYPIKTVLFERSNVLGFFEPQTYTIGIHKQMIYAGEEEIKNLLRHELGHYLCYLHFGNDVKDHGKEYRALCKACGWEKEIFLAKQNVSPEIIEQQKSSILKKVQKLFSLASSDNPHEAELATQKAKQLLVNHQLNYVDDLQDQFYMKRVLEGKRVQGKHYAISSILQEFHLLPVFNQGKGKFWLEITGAEEELEIGDYLASYLDQHLEKLWKKNQSLYKLRGLQAKNSFMTGVAKGHIEKLNKISIQGSSHKSALVKLQNELSRRSSLVYGRTGKASSQAGINSKSMSKGLLEGKNLSIKKALKNKNKNEILFLT